MALGWRADPWGYRLGLIGLGLFLLFVKLLPLGTVAGRLPGPDVMQCLIIAWAMRRPDFVPVWIVLPMVLLEDFLLWRAPGLWTALMVMAVEFLRTRAPMTRELNFMVEWLLASGLMVAMLLAYRAGHTLALMPQLPFGFTVVQLAATIATYPFIVALSRLAFDLKKPAHGTLDEYGRRL